MNWLDNSIKEYYSWLRDKTLVKEDKDTGWAVISTPFIGLYNDNIEIYIKKEADKIILSDDGMTLSNLELSGVSFSARSKKRQEYLNMILLNYGITREKNELKTVATSKDLSQKKHNLISAISEVSDMVVVAEQKDKSFFKEDLRDYLNEQEITNTPQFITTGTTGLAFTFDFQIAGREKELVLKSFNSLNKMNVPNFLFAWADVKEARERASGKELRSLAIIKNAGEKEDEFLEALKKKGSDYTMWDKRYTREAKAKLVA